MFHFLRASMLLFGTLLFGQSQEIEKNGDKIELSCTASWNGTNAGSCGKSKTYKAPEGWIIVGKKEKKSENNGKAKANISGDGQTLTVTVKADAHGNMFDRRRGWAKIEVTPLLRVENAENEQQPVTMSSDSTQNESIHDITNLIPLNKDESGKSMEVQGPAAMPLS